MNIRSITVALAAAAFAVIPFAARAEYPDHPIRYVLHVSPGGATDVMARKLGIELQKVLGQPFVIENRPGGRSAAQMAELSRAAPDGYTIGAVTSSHLAAFNTTLKQYNVGSLTWLAKLVYEPYIFVVRKDSPIEDMHGLIDAIKAQPGKAVIAGFTRGSGSHIAWEMLMHAAKLPSSSANWVPYNSVRDGVIAVLGGHGIATVAYVGLVKDQVAAGNLRVIGVLADKRLAQLPDVKTLKEQGLDVPTGWTQWRGVVGPKNMPDAVKNKLAAAITKAMNDDEMKTFVRNDSLVADVEGPVEFTKFVTEQNAITVDWLKQLGFIK
jgi:tripartite-type tricarboxylate transporter receptor subunit TctC